MSEEQVVLNEGFVWVVEWWDEFNNSSILLFTYRDDAERHKDQILDGQQDQCDEAEVCRVELYRQGVIS